MEEQELFEKVCQPRLERIEKKVDTLCDLLKGEGMDTGLIDDMRKLKCVYKYTVGAIIFVLTTAVVQISIWVRSKF